MPTPIRTAVFPVAGLGTRFLPATKAMPKEMLTVVDRPAIQYVVDEAREAGIEHFIFVTGRNKGVIEDHFDKQVELESVLRECDKIAEIEALARDLPGPGQTSFTRQQEPLGLGHAVWCARDLVGNKPFALLLPDVLVQSKGRSCLAQLLDVYHRTGGNVIAVEEVATEETQQYGVVSVGESLAGDTLYSVTGMVEKPRPGTAPSNLIILGRYLIQPEIFEILGQQGAGAGGEIQITDAMQRLMEEQPFYALEYDGQSFDCGSKVGFLVANIAYALQREDIADQFREELGKVLTAEARRQQAERMDDGALHPIASGL